jgi:hypothetical protein
LSPETPKYCAAVTASAARSLWLAAAGAGAELSNQVPPSTGPPNAGPWPELSAYCEVMVDQLSPEPPSPVKKSCR